MTTSAFVLGLLLGIFVGVPIYLALCAGIGVLLARLWPESADEAVRCDRARAK